MIPFFDYAPRLRENAAEYEAAVARVFASGHLILGPEVEAFESEFAAALGVAGAVGVANGTDAIALVLRALGIGHGDEVITVANAGVPPVAAIRVVGATPVLVDVTPQQLSIDAQALAAAIGPRTAAVLAVHLYGHPVDLDGVLAVTRRAGLPLIEDCAQALGATYHGRALGSVGVAGCFSFYPTKNLAAFGDGGAVVSDDRELLERIRRGRMYGYPQGQRHAVSEGVNSRLDELQAALLRVGLTRLADHNTERRRWADRYDRLLAGHVELVCGPEQAISARHLYVVQSAERARWVAALTEQGIGHGLHYEHAVHEMQAYRFLGQRVGSLPVTESACRRVLSLPLYPGLSEAVYERLAVVLERLSA